MDKKKKNKKRNKKKLYERCRKWEVVSAILRKSSYILNKNKKRQKKFDWKNELEKY